MSVKDRRSLQRLLGVALVWWMPDSGMDETLSILKDTFEFYKEDPLFLLESEPQPYTASFLKPESAPKIFLTA